MKRSIRHRFMVIFIGMMAAMLLAIWAINNWWLEGYYTSQKLGAMEEAYARLDAVVMDKVAAGEEIGDVIAREVEAERDLWNTNMKRYTISPGEDAVAGSGDTGRTRRDGMVRNAPKPLPEDPDTLEGEAAGILDENSLLGVIREFSEQHNMTIVLVDSITGNALLPSVREGDWLAQKVQRYILGIGSDQSEILAEHENYIVEKNYDPHSKSSHMEGWGFFCDNSTLFIMQMPLASIRDSVELSNRFTTYVGIVALLMGSILMYFVTRQVTKPILRLASLSERMSHLDFEASYEGDAEDEIGVLGRSMNILSDKLKETIGELQAANQVLQKDIEEKIQIDEMRKEFIANVSHELKTPIALIQGYAEGLTEGMCEDAESRSYYCEVIMDEAGKMNKMVKQLLTLTALEFGNDTPSMERFDINELIGDILNSASILIQQHDAQVEYEPDGPLEVWADEFKIEEVVTNYLNNAMNHLGGTRKIRIRTEVLDGGQVKVSVYNTGEAIPEEDIPNLWTKFFKVDKARTRAYGGSGIGLSIVKAIMDAHHESCGVANVEDGVEFWFTLARYDKILYNNES